MPDSIVPDKATLRRRFRAFRAQLGPSEYAARSAALVERAKALPELRQAGTVHTYWPVTARREVDVRPLATWLHAQGKQIVLPVVLRFSRDEEGTPRLAHARFEGADALRPNRWGIYEPVAGQRVPVEEIDVVLTPALGAGRNGHRVGHGFGYYDEFLRAVRAPTVGLVYAECLVETVPADAHDVPLTVILTEHEILRPAPA